MSDWTTPARPYSIAHRGASAYAADCSLEAYEKAARLGADFWEVDIRLSRDGVLITYHDAALPTGEALADLTAAEIAALAAAQNVPAVPFADVLALAVRHGAGIYADIKDTAATLATLEALKSHGIERAILGAFDPEAAALLKAADCPYLCSALVPIGADPFEHAKGADVIHLCWEHMARPQDLLDEAFFARAAAAGQKVALWHEEDPARMALLRNLPVLGICSDRPELVHPWRAPASWPVEIVCHRGACEFAPENTLAGAHCAFAAGFTCVELDVQQSCDGALVVIHDPSLDRTTTGQGAVTWLGADEIRSCDAGSWYSAHFSDQKVPTLDEVLDLTKTFGGRLYVELKSADPMRVLAAVRAKDMMSQCFFWAFDHDKLIALRKAAPEAAIMIRRQDVGDLSRALKNFTPQIVEFTPAEDWAEFAPCRAAGSKVMVAYMGRDEAMFGRIVDAQPDMVNLHFPFLFRDYLRSRDIL